MANRDFSLDRLSVFALLWGVATLIHQASFTGWITEGRPLGYLLTGLAGLVVIWPGSLALLVAMVALSVVYTYQRLPFIPNHILFEMFVNLTILAGIALGWREVRRRRLEGAAARERIYESFASTVRFEVIVLYFFVTWHKLNRDFFDPEVSCGGALWDMMADALPGLSSAYWIHLGCIAATILFEGGIPLLLIFRRTRALGIVVGFLFHFILGFVPHGGVYSFSTLMMTLLFLFTPPELFDSLEQTLRRLVDRFDVPAKLLYRALAMTGVVATYGLWVWAWQRAGWRSVVKVGFVHWLAWSAVLLACLLLAVRAESVTWNRFQVRMLPAYRALWLLPLLIALNGTSPYLGSKTQTSFAMFSNLRTEDDRPNHLIVPANLQIWDLQRDVIEIVNSRTGQLKFLQENDLRLPFWQFRSHLTRMEGDIDITFRRNGELQRLQRRGGVVTGDSALFEPLPYLSRKWLSFRAFDAGPKMGCRH